MSDKCNCYRFSPRDSLSGAVAQIADYLSKHPGWNETELKAVIDGLISATGVESFNGRTGAVILDKNDVNNLKIASAYFAEGDESIDSLDLVSLYKQGVRFVFTDFNSVTHGYNLAFALEYFSGSGNVVYYPMSTASGGGGNIVSVNGKTGEVRLKVVDVSNGNSGDENVYIFIDESEDYPDVLSSYWETIYPVGAIYINTNSTSPASIFGGVWEQLKDCFLLAASDTYKAGDVGGEKTHTLTHEEMPSHTHQTNVSGFSGWPSKQIYGYILNFNSDAILNKTAELTDFPNTSMGYVNMVATGGDNPHNNMPPYLSVYMWKRVS